MHEQTKRLQLFARVAAAVISLGGGLVLMGWALDNAVLKSFIPGLVAMNPATAVMFIIAAIGLALHTVHVEDWRFGLGIFPDTDCGEAESRKSLAGRRPKLPVGGRRCDDPRSNSGLPVMRGGKSPLASHSIRPSESHPPSTLVRRDGHGKVDPRLVRVHASLLLKADEGGEDP